MARGILYVMSTIVPGLIKIGKTGSDNYKNRMYSLEHNGYRQVVGLKRRFAIEVDDYDEKEQLLDSIFSKSQVGDTELFATDIELVVQLLSAFDGKVIYPENADKEDIFDDATAKRKSNAKDKNDKADDDKPRVLTDSERKRVDYWKHFYDVMSKNEKAVKAFGDPVTRAQNGPDTWKSFALGYGGDCYIVIAHRTKANSIVCQIYLDTPKCYDVLMDNREKIDAAVSTYSPAIEWDDADSPKQSRHVNIRFPHTSDTEADFNKVINTMIMLRETIQEILG